MTNNLEDLIFRFRWQIAFLLVGITLAAGGVFLTLQPKTPDVKIIASTENSNGKMIVEVSGAVQNANVYELESGSRIEDAISAAGGLTSEADRNWIERYLNRAALVSDGQKIYIPSTSEQMEGQSDNNLGGDESASNVLSIQNGGSVNINTATQSQLEDLKGIGPVYAQKIIENRPYSTVEELSSKEIIPKNTFENIKNSISVY